MARIKWYEKYLPFVAQSVEKQYSWLERELRRSLKDPAGGRCLSVDEIQPYVRLFLEDEEESRQKKLTSLLQNMDEELAGQMLRAADIYDATTLFGLLGHPEAGHIEIALTKEPPSHEKNPHMVTDKLFLEVHNKASGIMESTVAAMRKKGTTSNRFEKAYTRFREMLMDEEVLSLLFPKAKA